jgi:hypothetical protein
MADPNTANGATSTLTVKIHLVHGTFRPFCARSYRRDARDGLQHGHRLRSRRGRPGRLTDKLIAGCLRPGAGAPMRFRVRLRATQGLRRALPGLVVTRRQDGGAPGCGATRALLDPAARPKVSRDVSDLDLAIGSPAESEVPGRCAIPRPSRRPQTQSRPRFLGSRFGARENRCDRRCTR